MAGHGSRFPHLKETAIGALLLHKGDVDAAAAEVGIAPRTLRAWMLRPRFAQALQHWRAAILEGQVNRLTQLTAQAIDTLEQGLKAKKAADRTRAARAILEFRERLSRDQLKDRLDALERQLTDLRQGKGMTVNGPLIGNVSVCPEAFRAFIQHGRDDAKPPTPKVIDQMPGTEPAEGQP